MLLKGCQKVSWNESMINLLRNLKELRLEMHIGFKQEATLRKYKALT